MLTFCSSSCTSTSAGLVTCRTKNFVIVFVGLVMVFGTSVASFSYVAGIAATFSISFSCSISLRIKCEIKTSSKINKNLVCYLAFSISRAYFVRIPLARQAFWTVVLLWTTQSKF